MTRRLKAPQRRARRAARLKLQGGERDFDLFAVAEAHHVPVQLVKGLVAAAPQLPLSSLLMDRLSAALADQIRFSSFDEVLRLPVLMLVGPPGAGKTTLAAKLAARMGERRALLVSTDISRPG